MDMSMFRVQAMMWLDPAASRGGRLPNVACKDYFEPFPFKAVSLQILMPRWSDCEGFSFH